MSITTTRPLSTLASLLAGQQNIDRLNAQVQQASQEVSTGLRANVYADLGQTASITLQLRGQMDQTAAYVTSNTLLGNKMDVMSTALGSVYDQAQSVLAQAVSNLDAPGASAATLQQQARASLDAITSALNTNYAGGYLFSDTSTDAPPLQSYTAASATTGKSPQDALTAIVGSGPTSAADAASMATSLDQIFGSTYSTDPSLNYEGTFYNGTPASDASGTPNPRVTGAIAQDQTISYGVQANDPSIRGILQGLTMLVSTDVSKISDAGAYKAWMQSAVAALSGGVQGLTGVQAQLGSQQQLVEQTATQQGDLKNVYNNRVLGYEQVDPYEAASRLTALQSQLNATYAATAQLSKLSILDYL